MFVRNFIYSSNFICNKKRLHSNYAHSSQNNNNNNNNENKFLLLSLGILYYVFYVKHR